MLPSVELIVDRGLDNKRIGEVFGGSLNVVTKATQPISEQRETEKRLKKETDGILYSIFKVCPHCSPGKKKKENDLPDAELLLSIVVEYHYQGKGVAKKLFIKLVDEFKNRGASRFKVVVGSNLIAACRFYEKMGGVFFSETEVHRGEKSRIYKWDI